MTKKNIIKAIKQEMRIIAKEQDIKLWESLEVEDMNGDDAFTRGYYRACEAILPLMK